MKVRTLIVTILGVLLVSSVSPAQDAVASEQEPTLAVEPVEALPSATTSPRPRATSTARTATSARRPATRTVGRTAAPMPPRTPPAASEGPTQVEIFELKHASAVDMSNLISSVLGIRVAIDSRLNRLIVSATKEQVQTVENLITAMDVEGPEASTSRGVQNLVYRVYMFEIPSGDQGMKPFSMILRTTTHVSSQELLDAAADKDLQISEFLQSNDFNVPNVEILIKGKAASNESLKRLVEKFPESHVIEFKWDDDAETFTDNIAAAQYTQLPEQMQKHIGKFLGDEIRTVGYWFGNLSLPGEVEAPIGPWKLSLQLDTESDRMVQLQVDVEAVGEIEQIGEETWRQQTDEILSNTLRAKIGKPIIIGYNRESYGTRKMGAMVIVPEADSVQSDTADTNAF